MLRSPVNKTEITMNYTQPWEPQPTVPPDAVCDRCGVPLNDANLASIELEPGTDAEDAMADEIAGASVHLLVCRACA